MSYTYQYPRPAVTADCAVFTREAETKVLLIQRGNDPFKGKWAFPGGFMNMDETTEQCAIRELKEETGLGISQVNQIGVYSKVDRDPRGRTLSVAYLAIVDKPYEVKGQDDAAKAEWFLLKDLPELAFDHDEIMTDAITLYGRLTSKNEKIRTASIADLDEISQLEASCFPEAEAATKETFRWRLNAYPSHFWVLEQDGKIISFINGPVTEEQDLMDEMYEDPAFCKENGKWQMVFGVVTHPFFQHQGCASRLMNQFILHAKEEGKSGIVLTCKKEKISFYEQFGFKNEGLSTSTHGGVPWYQMRLSF